MNYFYLINNYKYLENTLPSNYIINIFESSMISKKNEFNMKFIDEKNGTN